MAATDYIGAVYDQIWAYLEAHTAWTALVGVANRIKLAADKPDPTKNHWSDDDFPEATLLYGAMNDSMFTATPAYRYQTTYAPATQTWTEAIAQDYTLILIHKDLRRTLLRAETLTAFRKPTGAPRLGLTYVKSFGPILAPPDQIVVGRAGDASTGGTKRLMTVLTIPVLMQFNSSALIT